MQQKFDFAVIKKKKNWYNFYIEKASTPLASVTDIVPFNRSNFM